MISKIKTNNKNLLNDPTDPTYRERMDKAFLELGRKAKENVWHS